MLSTVVALSWFVASGDVDPAIAAVVAVAALVVLPGALVVAAAAERLPADLALVDLATVAVRGGIPAVDTYVEGLVPAALVTG